MAIRVLYTGPARAGVRTTVRYIARSSETTLEEYPQLGLTTTRRGHPLRICADVRSRLDFRTAREALENCEPTLRPCYRAHIDFLGEIDGIVFVVDSQESRLEGAREAVDRLRRDLEERGRDATKIPVVFQCNKRDLPTALPLDEMTAGLRWPRCDHRPSVALGGKSVFDALDTLLAIVTAH